MLLDYIQWVEKSIAFTLLIQNIHTLQNRQNSIRILISILFHWYPCSFPLQYYFEADSGHFFSFVYILVFLFKKKHSEKYNDHTSITLKRKRK